MKPEFGRRWGLGVLLPALLACPGIAGLLTGQTWVPAMWQAGGDSHMVVAAGRSGRGFALVWLLAALLTHLEFFRKNGAAWTRWLDLLQKSALTLFAGGLFWALWRWIADSLSA